MLPAARTDAAAVIECKGCKKIKSKILEMIATGGTVYGQRLDVLDSGYAMRTFLSPTVRPERASVHPSSEIHIKYAALT